MRVSTTQGAPIVSRSPARTIPLWLLTQTLKKSLALVDVRVVDHFIIAGNEQPLSMAERGLV